MSNLNNNFAELRAILTERPTRAQWTQLTNILDSFPRTYLCDVALPYCREHISANTHWKQFRRTPPQSWTLSLFQDLRLHPALILASHIEGWCCQEGGEDSVIKLLTSSFDMTLVRTLTLRSFVWTDAHLEKLAGSDNAHYLRALQLSDQNGEPFTERGVKTLVTSPNLANLELLDLSSNKLGDASALAIAHDINLPRLKWLKFDNNTITQIGIDAIETSERLPSTIRTNWKQYATSST